jgi:hypothetical protein
VRANRLERADDLTGVHVVPPVHLRQDGFVRRAEVPVVDHHNASPSDDTGEADRAAVDG